MCDIKQNQKYYEQNEGRNKKNTNNDARKKTVITEKKLTTKDKQDKNEELHEDHIKHK